MQTAGFIIQNLALLAIQANLTNPTSWKNSSKAEGYLAYASSDVIHDWVHASQILSVTILSPEECSKRFGGLPPTYSKE